MNGTGIYYDGMFQAYFKGQWLGASADRMTAWRAIAQFVKIEMENAQCKN
jgi:uncharacterized membrane protein